VRLRLAGHTAPEIAARLPGGRTANAVWNLLKRRGVSVEPRPRAKESYGRGHYGDWHEPTEAELDALIAEQSRPENLPAWWASECERVALAERERESQLDAVVRESSRVRVLGRGVRVPAGR
jgi:hypothetical protein